MVAVSKNSKDAIMTQAKTAFRAIAGQLDNVITDVEELRTAICLTGRNPSREQCEKAWEKAKAGNEVDFTEFCEIIFDLPRPTRKELLDSFRALDTNNDETLDIAEFTRLLSTAGSEKMSRHEIEEIFSQADANNDGRLDYEEFVDFMLQTIKKCDQLEPSKNFSNSPKPTPREVRRESLARRVSRENSVLQSKKFSDYDTELVFSDLETQTEKNNFVMTNLSPKSQPQKSPEKKPKKFSFFSRSRSKDTINSVNNFMNLPMDLVHIKQSAFASQKSHTMPRNHPWTSVKELATLLFPGFAIRGGQTCNGHFDYRFSSQRRLRRRCLEPK